MAIVGVDSGSLHKRTHSLSRLAWSWVGSCLAPFYINQMNRVNSRNGSCHDDSTINIVICIIIIIIIIIITCYCTDSTKAASFVMLLGYSQNLRCLSNTYRALSPAGNTGSIRRVCLAAITKQQSFTSQLLQRLYTLLTAV